MKKEKKESRAWYIAATHYLTSGFVIPLILSLLVMFLLNSFFGSAYQLAQYIILLLTALLSIWLGVIYSASYLQKTYKIKEAKKIVGYSSAYFAVFTVLLALLDISSALVDIYKKSGFATAFWFIFFPFVYFTVALAVFYFSSKKYIKNNT